jgi:hypothetical protein
MEQLRAGHRLGGTSASLICPNGTRIAAPGVIELGAGSELDRITIIRRRNNGHLR